MAMFKSVSDGRTGLYKVWRYLLHANSREVLGQDVFNVVGEEEQELWYRPMDLLRKQYGNDAAWNGKKAVTYRHFVISPDPKDGCSLEKLRELAARWVEAFFSDYQVAVVYHDDNENHIQHAHIVVNNTNMLTGKRLHISNAMRDVVMPNLVQTLSHQLGLSAMPNLHPGDAGLTKQQEYRSRAERAMKRETDVGVQDPQWETPGRWKSASWVAQIREQVEKVAAGAGRPLTFDEFRAFMQADGYDVYPTKRGYTYVHPGGPRDKSSRERTVDANGNPMHWKIKDKRLGLKYTPYGMVRWLNVGSEQPLAQGMIASANRREVAAFKRYQRAYLALIADISAQDRVDAFSTVVREGVDGGGGFAEARARLEGAIASIDAQVEECAGEQGRATALLEVLSEYEKLLPIAARYNAYSEKEDDRQLARRYREAHSAALGAFENARNQLEREGVGDAADIEALRLRATDLERKSAGLVAERASIEKRLEDLERAQEIAVRIAVARKEARQKTVVEYAYRGVRTETVALHTRQDENGDTWYDIVKTQEIRYWKTQVAEREDERAVKRAPKRQTPEEPTHSQQDATLAQSRKQQERSL